jgi:hypothetical protein
VPACATGALVEVDGVAPFAVDARWPALPPLAACPAELCGDVDVSVFAAASVVSSLLPGVVLSSLQALADTSAKATKPKRKVDLFIFIPCRVELRISERAVMGAQRSDASPSCARYAVELGPCETAGLRLLSAS